MQANLMSVLDFQPANTAAPSLQEMDRMAGPRQQPGPVFVGGKCNPVSIVGSDGPIKAHSATELPGTKKELFTGKTKAI